MAAWLPAAVGYILYILLPFCFGYVLDMLFHTGSRWRWWFPPLLVGLAGSALVSAIAIWPTTDVSQNESGAFIYVILVFLLILLPAAVAASGVWLRGWVARSAAKRPRGEIRAARK